MGRLGWLIVGVCLAEVPFALTGCGPTRVGRPEQDLTPFEQLVRLWTSDYHFRRAIGGTDLVSEQASITERPTHEESLLLEATLFSDTLVQADIERLCEEDTTATPCDSIAARYREKYHLPGLFRVEVYALATLSKPFALKPLTVYITDEDGIDYEPRRAEFAKPVTEQHTYLDREVKRYDPYTAWEYRVYQYKRGYEYQSTGHATYYFDRVNVIGKDLLGPNARLTLTFRKRRSDIAAVSWDLGELRERMAAGRTPK